LMLNRVEFLGHGAPSAAKLAKAKVWIASILVIR